VSTPYEDPPEPYEAIFEFLFGAVISIEYATIFAAKTLFPVLFAPLYNI
jgi:hypothetical protein